MSPNETAVAPVAEQDFLTRLNAWLRNASASVARAPDFGVPNPFLHGPADYTPQAIGAAGAPNPQIGSMSNLGGNLGAIVAPSGHEEAFRQIAQNVAEGTPRIVADVGLGPAALVADMGLSGYGGARERGAGDAAAVTSGAVGATLGALLPGAARIGGEFVGSGLARTPLVNETAQRVAEFAGGQVAQVGTMEAARQAQSVLSGEGFQNPLTAEHAFETVISTAPFAALGAKESLFPTGRVGPDGLVDIPLTATQRARAENALSARAAATESPQQALIDGPPANPASEPLNVTPTTGGDTLSPLAALRPDAPVAEAQAAHEEFIRAAGLDSTAESDGKPSIEYLGKKNLAVEGVGEPVDQWQVKMPGEERGVTMTKEQMDAAGHPTEVPVDMSLTNKLGANFGDTKQMTPTLILDRILAGEIAPTGVEGGENNVKLVQDLQQAFVRDPGLRGETYVNMPKVLDMAKLAQARLDDAQKAQARLTIDKLTDPEAQIKLDSTIDEAWNKLNTMEKTGSIAAAKILQDPYAVLGKDPTTGGLPESHWSVQPITPNSFLRTVHNSAGALYNKWNKPVETVSDAGTMVRDVNFFVDTIKRGVLEHVGQESLDQLNREGGMAPVTLEYIQEKYQGYLGQYLNHPDAEAQARVLQTVKNKILLAAQTAKEQMLKQPKFQEFGNPPQPKDEQLDSSRDAEFKKAIESQPPDIQKKLTDSYVKFREEKISKQGESYWKLDQFRDAVIKGNLPLTPEAEEKIKPTRNLEGRLGGKRGISYDDWLEQVLGQKKEEAEGADATPEDETVTPEEQAVAAAGTTPTEAPNTLNESTISKYFDGTPRDPQEVMQELKPLEFETIVETSLKKKFSSLVTPLAIQSGKTQHQLSQSGEGVQFVKDFLAADYNEAADERATWAEKAGFKYDRVNNNWKDIRRSMMGRDEARTTWLKARLMGLTPKEGVTPETFLKATKEVKARKAKAEKFTFDARDSFYRSFLEKGYQPELAKVLADQIVPLTKNFAGLDNASFAMLTDRQAAASQFESGLRVLGVHLPNTTIIDGKPVLNSIVAVAMNDYINNKAYAAFNGFIKIATLAHEQYHAFAKNVVDNPNFGDMNADTAAQVEAVQNMRKFSKDLPVDDRVRVASTLIDAMVPPKYTRDEKGKFTPEVQGLIKGATRNPEEFVAFYYQMVATGLASRMADSAGKQGVVQAPRVTNDMRDAMMWLTHDEQAFIRGQFRNLGDMLEALQKVLDDPLYREEQGYVKTEKEQRNVEPQPGESGPLEPKTMKTKFTTPSTMSVGTTAVELARAAQTVARGGKPLESARITQPADPTHYQVLKKLVDVDIRVARAEAMLKSLEVNINTPDMFESAANGQIKEIDVSQLPPVKDFMLGFGAPPGSKTPEELGRQWWNGKLPSQQNKHHEWFLKRWFAPFQYRTADLSARGLKLAEDMRQTLGSVQPTAHLLNHAFLDNITARFDKFGDVKVDTTKDFFKFLNNGKETDPNARKALNNIIAKQQELRGVDVNDPTMQAFVQKELQNVAPPKRTLVTTAVKTINDTYSTMRDIKFKSAVETQRNLIAQLALVMNPTKLTAEQAKELGTAAIGISETGDLARQQQWVQSLTAQGFKPETAGALLQVASNGWQYLQNLNASMKALGNFASEVRVGPYILQYTNKNGDHKTIGIKDNAEGETKAGQLMRAGATDLKKIDQSQKAEDASMFSGAAGDKVAQMAKDTFDKQVAYVAAIDPDMADFIKANYDPSAGIAEYKAVNAVQQSARRRNLKGGREDIDYVETMIDQASRTSVALARRSARQDFMLQRTELSQMGQEELAKDLDSQLAEVMAPSNTTVDKIKTIAVAKYLVKPASAIIEGMQMLSSGNAMLFQEGLSPKQISETWQNALGKLLTWKNADKNTQQFTQDARIGAQIEKDRLTGQQPIENKNASVAYALQRMNDEGRLGYEPILDVTGEDNLNVNLARATRTNNFAWSSMGDMASNGIYNVAKNALRLYGIMPRMNNWLAAAASLEVGYDKGLRGDALQSYALGLKDRMAVTGGRENRPTIFSKLGQNKIARPAVSLASLMSTYTLGMTTIMARSTKEALMSAPGLTPPQRTASAKTAGYVLSVQLAMAGALGLPGVAAALWAVENTFHVDAEVAVRKFVKDASEFLGADKEMANVVSDSAMNGVYNSLTGLDYASRAGLNTLFGVNGYNGFDPWGVTGPVGGMAKDGFNALTVASQGQFGQAAKLMSPDGLKPMVDMFNNEMKYGDNRQMDASGNLVMKPTTKDNIGLALSFTPHKLRQAKQEARLLANSNKRFNDAHGRELDDIAASIVRGDKPDIYKDTIVNAVKLRKASPGFSPHDYVQGIVDRALDMQMPRDPMSTGPMGNAAKDSEIGSLFNNQRSSELQRLMARDLLYSKFGFVFGLHPATPKERTKAVLVDLMIKQRGLSRPEAVNLVERLTAGPTANPF